MIVVDATVIVPALVDDGGLGRRARRMLLADEVAAPQLVDIDVMSALRRLASSGLVSNERAGEAVHDLTTLALLREPHVPLLAHCWELRDDVTAYDATYVALAEALGVTLVTGDQRLAAAPGPRCPIEVLPA